MIYIILNFLKASSRGMRGREKKNILPYKHFTQHVLCNSDTNYMHSIKDCVKHLDFRVDQNKGVLN